MQQLFINNWSAELTAPLAAGAESLSISSVLADQLSGMVDDNYYHLTLVETAGDGLEIRWEVVRVWSSAAGLLTVSRAMEDTAEDQAWPAGTRIEARFSAGAIQGLREEIQYAENRARDASRPLAGAPVLLVSDSTYTLSPGDAGYCIYFASATSVTVQIQLEEGGAWPDWSEIDLVQAGTGQVQVSSAGITLRKPASLNACTAEQESVITLKRRGPDEWGLFGHLEPV